MADCALVISLDGPLKERVEKAARAVGSSVNAFVAQTLDFAVDPDTDWVIDQTIADETLTNGDGIPLDQFVYRLERFGKATE